MHYIKSSSTEYKDINIKISKLRHLHCNTSIKYVDILETLVLLENKCFKKIAELLLFIELIVDQTKAILNPQ